MAKKLFTTSKPGAKVVVSDVLTYEFQVGKGTPVAEKHEAKIESYPWLTEFVEPKSASEVLKDTTEKYVASAKEYADKAEAAAKVARDASDAAVKSAALLYARIEQMEEEESEAAKAAESESSVAADVEAELLDGEGSDENGNDEVGVDSLGLPKPATEALIAFGLRHVSDVSAFVDAGKSLDDIDGIGKPTADKIISLLP